MKKTLFVALNEFNEKLLFDAAKKLDLKNLQMALSFSRSETITEDTYDSDFLEPWVQWVSVQAEIPSTEHHIKHLGDVPHLSTPQIWERLSDQGISSGIWGAMNASKGCSEHCHFFLPDPWTASEVAYPNELNDLLLPLRYFAKNYLAKTRQQTIHNIRLLLRTLSKYRLGRKAIGRMPRLVQLLLKHPGHNFPFICFFDYLSTLLFLEYKRKYNPDFSMIFINSLAHLQHHHWKKTDVIENPPLVYGLKNIDVLLGLLLKEEGEFVMANALSQKNTQDEKPWLLYRQIDQAKFLQAIGIVFTRVESHMTHDAHIFFDSETKRDEAFEALRKVEIKNIPLFFVESYEEDPKKLFYRICFTDPVDKSTKFSLNGKSFLFFRYFQAIVQRTGKHIQTGSIFSSRPLPKRMKNHEIFSHLFPNKERQNLSSETSMATPK